MNGPFSDNNFKNPARYIYLAEFLKTLQNGPEYSHRNLAIARFLVTAVRKNIGGLLSWLVSLSSSVPELTRHRLGRGLHVNPYRGEGAAKAWYCPLFLLWQSQCTGHVCLKFVMSNSFNV